MNIFLFQASTDILDVVTSSAASLDVVASWVDANSSLAAQGGGRTRTQISSAGTNSIVPTPGTSLVRRVKTITIRNHDASLANDVTIRHNDGTTAIELFKETLQPGWTWVLVEGQPPYVYKPSTTRSGLKNISTADQSIGASVTVYLTGSAIPLPNPSLVGTLLRWRYHIAKTAAATAQEIVAVRFGTNGSTADTARCSATLDVETAIADEMIVRVEAVIRGPIGASCIVQASFEANDNLTTTGFSNTARKAQVQAIQSAAFDITPAGTIAGLSVQSGASHSLTVRQVSAEYWTAQG